MATTYEVSEGIATLTLNRPERLNAFNEDLVRGALKAVDQARIDPDVKALVLTGSGRGFCAGADLAGGLAPTGEGVNAAMRDLYNPLILAIDDFPKTPSPNGFKIQRNKLRELAEAELARS